LDGSKNLVIIETVNINNKEKGTKMRDQKERVSSIENLMKNEFRHALAVNVITQAEH